MVEEIPGESESFQKLVVIERQVDALIKRRKIEILEAVARPTHLQKKLRLYLYSTHHHQSSTDPLQGSFLLYCSFTFFGLMKYPTK